jgi:hypothetical protein
MKASISRELVLLTELHDLHFGQFGGLAGERGPLKKQRADFLVERACVPSFNAAHLGVEFAFERVLDGDEQDEVGPRQFCSQRLQNHRIGKHFGETDHVG